MPKNLLVADDSVVIQKSIGITLAQEDLAITYVGNGEDALAKARQSKPDLILADVVMPKKNGYELCEEVKKDPALQSIPVLLLSGTHEPYDENRGKSVGANGHIIKPFESKTLLDQVQALLSGKVPVASSVPTASVTPPPPSPTIPSPASTIAGQSPFVASIPTPPPPRVEVTSEPMTPQRDTPMLDLEIPNPDFSEAPTAGSMVEPLETAPIVDLGPKIEDEEDATAKLPEADGFWDFSQEEASPAPVPESQATPIQELPEAPWQTTPQPAIDLSPLAEERKPSTTDADEFGFDLATEDLPSSDSAVENPPPAPVFPELSVDPVSPSLEMVSPATMSLSDEQIEKIVTNVFQKVIERIAWEVVPDLSERIIREELGRLTKEPS